MSTDDAERARLRDDPAGWRRWGPYLSERAWGTVREDYSANGDAWNYVPHDHARSRAFRWSEEGLGGICDEHQLLCLGFAFWNGVDAVLKERIFGLTGPQGNHGEDAKEYWWYVDSTPTHSWMRWRYLYPQSAFPYDQLIAENARRTQFDPEYELADTGVLDDGFWDITVDYAKETPEDLVLELRVRNAGATAQTLHVLPTLWFRNTWAWGIVDTRPALHVENDRVVCRPHGGRPDVPDRRRRLHACSSATTSPTRRGSGGRQPQSSFPKDGINDHVIDGAQTVNPAQVGTKAALHYVLASTPATTATIRLRFGRREDRCRRRCRAALELRRREADAFYASVIRQGSRPTSGLVARQALSGMLWGKQFYHYNVTRWLDGDPAEPHAATGAARGT